MISKELSATLGFAVKEAKRRRHEYVSIEHILFAILNDPNGIEIIENCGGDVDNLLVFVDLVGGFGVVVVVVVALVVVVVDIVVVVRGVVVDVVVLGVGMASRFGDLMPHKKFQNRSAADSLLGS